VESAEGKKSSEKFNATVEAKQKEAEKRQKELEDLTNKLRTQERVLSDAAKVDLQRDIDRRQIELTRFNEDAQKDVADLREKLLRPLTEVANAILNAYAAERGFTVIIDVSNPQNNVVYANPSADITAELIRRIDAEMAKRAPAQSSAPAPPAPAAGQKPAAQAPAATPKPATPTPGQKP
jgi:outer membrane protein